MLTVSMRLMVDADTGGRVEQQEVFGCKVDPDLAMLAAELRGFAFAHRGQDLLARGPAQVENAAHVDRHDRVELAGDPAGHFGAADHQVFWAQAGEDRTAGGGCRNAPAADPDG